MIRKLAILFFILLVGFILCLVMPLPPSAINISYDEFLPEKSTVFIPDSSEDQHKCQDGTLYIKQSQFGYADSEVINERCAALQTGLANAAIEGNLVEMRILFQKGASAQSGAFSKHSSDASKPVITAAWNKQTQAVKLLLDNGANVNSHYSCCMTSRSLLMIAVSVNDAATTKLLLARNADLGFKDQFEGSDVFDEANRINNPVILEMLYNACESSIGSRIKCRLRWVPHLFG